MPPDGPFFQVPIIYDTHALRRMRQRGITEGQVREVLGNPDSTKPAKQPGAYLLTKKLVGGRELLVVRRQAEDAITVYSVWWTR